jgi:molecular chaperone DnaK (HSP70)
VGGVPSELRAYTDPRALSPTYQYSAEVLTQEYLSQLRRHTLRILRSKLGDGVVDTTSIEYVITVPAIWSEGAKDLTRCCAIDAGFGANIHIISEPEAAAIYTLDTMDPHNLQIGDTFILCDAGGGTIDLITYSVLELKPILKLRETVPGAGHTCGSTYLNRIFRKYLEDTFSGDDGWEADTIEEATAHFENTTKRKFDGGNGKYLIPVRGLADNPEKSVKRSHFTILGSRLVELFEPVMANIKNLVIEQVLQSKSVKAVLLVGGFGQSVYLREVIKGAVGPEVQVLQPPQGWTAVVRGALIKGLAETAPETSRVHVKTRSARKAWGILNSVPFKDAIHDSSKRYVNLTFNKWAEC